jgi:phosphoribosylglycinamide formyltransferase-1
MPDRLRTAILISGRGSNMQALIEACASEDFPAKIALVLSNVADAAGLSRAQAAGIPTATVPYTDYPAREAFDAAMEAKLSEAGAEFVCLAGFMRILSDGFVRRWQGRMINIHPSLLPAFKGTKVHEQAIAAGVRLSGCTVHYVTPALDSGPAIAQASVPVHPDDTAEALAARILEAEHKLYPLALKLIAEGRVRLENGRAVFRDCPVADGALFNPPL